MAEQAALMELDLMRERCAALTQSLHSVIVGQHDAIEHLLVATFCQRHALLVGVPGLAKTLLVRTLASSLDLSFKRIQFTPDMMPADVLGAELLETDPESGRRRLRFAPGPVFANIVLADEVNRTPPRTQAALLEAMAERQVSIGGATRNLPDPFVVVATQNPIEQEGTYPLPEAQLDRFMFSVAMDYPKPGEEVRIAMESETIAAQAEHIEPVFGADDLQRLRALIVQIPVSEHVAEYAVALARASRPDDPTCPDDLRRFIQWGAGPRAPQMMLLAARCLAAMEGQPTPDTHHVQRAAPAALRHRIVRSYAASADGITEDSIVERLLQSVTTSSAP